MTTRHEASGDPDGTGTDLGALSRTDSTAKLADQLSRSYDFLPLTELAKDDPDRAQEHHDTAHTLRGWLRGLRKEEEKEAFQRGWDRAMGRAQRRIADLEAVIASQQSGENLPAPSSVVPRPPGPALRPRTAGDRRSLPLSDVVVRSTCPRCCAGVFAVRWLDQGDHLRGRAVRFPTATERAPAWPAEP